MSFIHRLLNHIGDFLHRLVNALPKIVKEYGPKLLHVGNQIKTALNSKEAHLIEAALDQLIPGTWDEEVIAAINKGLAVAVPGLTGIVEHSDLATVDQAKAFVAYLQGLSPKMQNAALLKLISSILMVLDPDMTEVEADLAAQALYSKSVQGNKQD